MSDLDLGPPFRPRKIWTPKRFLFKIYLDLERVSDNCFPHYDEGPLRPVDYMILALEDRRYFSHYGVDIISVLRESLRAITLRKHGGASTIEMQFIRTCLNYRDKTLSRKLYEMLLASIIQFRHSKMTVFRSYQDIMFLGSGLTGVDQASEKLFRKSAFDLNDEEASYIAAMMVYPRPVHPTEKWNTNVTRRRKYGLKLVPLLKDRFDKMHARHLA